MALAMVRSLHGTTLSDGQELAWYPHLVMVRSLHGTTLSDGQELAWYHT